MILLSLGYCYIYWLFGCTCIEDDYRGINKPLKYQLGMMIVVLLYLLIKESWQNSTYYIDGYICLDFACMCLIVVILYLYYCVPLSPVLLLSAQYLMVLLFHKAVLKCQVCISIYYFTVLECQVQFYYITVLETILPFEML